MKKGYDSLRHLDEIATSVYQVPFRWVFLFCLSSAVFLTCSSSIRTQTRHPVTIEDLVTLKDLDWHMEVSPDDETLAYVANDTIWLIGTNEGSTPRKLGKGTMPRWSPNGSQLAFYSSASGQLQLWLMNMSDHTLVQLTTMTQGIDPDPRTRFSGWVGDPLRYCWSPDGTTIAFVSRATAVESMIESKIESIPDPLSPLVLTSTSTKAKALSGVFRGQATTTSHDAPSQIFLVNTSSRKLRQLTHDAAQYFNPSWSPNGRAIVCGSTEGRSLTGDSELASNVYTIDVATASRKALTSGPGIKRLPYWSPDGKQIAYLGSERYGLRSIFLVSAEWPMKPTCLTAKLQRGVIYFFWSADSQSVIATVQDGVSWPIVKIDRKSGSYERLTKGEGVFWPFTTRGANGLVWALSNGSTHEAIQVAVSSSDTPFTLVEINPQIREWDLGKQQIIRWKNSRGELLEGILIMPSIGKKKMHPLIVDLYSTRTNGFMGSNILANQALVSRGYAVFFPNYRAHHNWMNYTKDSAYSLVARGEHGGEIMIDDILSGLKVLLARGLVDPDRLGLYGYSNGATAVNYLLTKTSMFKCAVSAEGFADWTLSYFLETDIAYTAATMRGQTPWDNPRAYIELSPVYHLDRINTPLLLAVGDKGSPARLLSYISMFNGLHSLGREVTLIRYPGQPHVFSGPNLLDYWRRVFNFLEAHLQSPK